MSKTKQLLLLVLIITGMASAQVKFDPQQGPKPIAMTAHAFDPFGPFSPSMVLYDDGQIICAQHDKEQGWFYAHKQLSSGELAEVKKTLAAFGHWSDFHQRHAPCPDCGAMVLYLKLGDESLAIRVWDSTLLSPERVPTNDNDNGSKEYRQNLIKLNQYLRTLQFTSTKPWEPLFFKVTFLDAWQQEDRPSPKKKPDVRAVQWPREWPGLDAPTTDHDMALHYIYLPGTELSLLRSLLGHTDQRVSVEIDGKAGTAKYRYILPHEQDWNKPLNNKESIP